MKPNRLLLMRLKQILKNTLIVCTMSALCASPVYSKKKTKNPDNLLVVDCLLPGQVRQLGTSRTYLTAKRPIKTSAADCGIRGGEYVSYDRANYATALRVWLPAAKAGDPAAQTYVGEIYEKGLGLPPDHALAAKWYQLAAAQDHTPAQLNLGYLYEKGLGVEQNAVEALNWYRRASGLVSDDLEFASTIEVSMAAKDQEIQSLQQQTQQQQAEIQGLQNKLSSQQEVLEQRKRELNNTQKRLNDVRQKLNQPSQQNSTSNESVELKALLGQYKSEAEKQRKSLVIMEAKLIERDATIEQLENNSAQKQQELNNKLTSSDQRTEELRNQLRENEVTLEKAREKLQKKTKDESLVQKLQESEEIRRQLEAQINTQENQARSLENQLFKIQSDLAIANTTLEQSRQSDSLLRERASSTASQKQKLEAQLGNMESSSKQVQKELRDAQSALQTALNQAKAENKQQVQKIEKVESEKNRLAAQVDSQDAEVSALRAQLASMGLSLNEREADISKLDSAAQQEQQKLRDQLIASQNQAENLRQSLISKEQDLRQAQDSLLANTKDESLAAKLKATEEKRRQLDDEVNAQKLASSSLQQQLSSLQAELNNANSKLASAKSNDKTLSRQVEETRLQKEALEQQISQMQSDVASTRGELTQARKTLQSALDLARQQNESQVARIEKMEAEKNRLSAQINTQEVESETYRREIAAVQSDLIRLKSEMAQQQQQFSDRQRELELERERVALLNTQISKQKASSDQQLKQLETEYLEKLAQQQQQLEAQQLQMEQDKKRLQRIETVPTVASAIEPTMVIGPTIELIDPPVIVTRSASTPVATLRSAVDVREVVGRVIAPAGLELFSINDKTTTVSENGIFKTQVPITDEATNVQLVAIDQLGQRNTLSFVLQRGDEAQQPVKKRSKNKRRLKVKGLGKYYALIIGNNKYSDYPKLNAARRDAEAIAKVLRKEYRFKTKLLVDATRYEIMTALNDYREKLTDKDNLLLYFAGHGELAKGSEVKGYWLPVDAERNSNVNWIPNSAITELIESMTAKHVLVVADSCYSGTMSRSSLARVTPEMAPKLRAKHISILAKRTARIVITSGGLKPVADSVGGKHSIFAQAFLDALTENEDVIEVWNLFRNIQSGMQRLGSASGFDQEPQYAPIKHAGHGGGMFFFAPS